MSSPKQTVPPAATTEVGAKKEPAVNGKKQRYLELNEVVRKNLTATLALCNALWEIKRDGLYIYGGYRNFPEYVAKEHGLGKSSIHQYANSGEVLQLLKKSPSLQNVDKPTNQAQVRPLLNIKDENKQVLVWSEAVKLAKLEPSASGKVTESIVAKAKRRILGPEKQAEPQMPRQKLTKLLWNPCGSIGRWMKKQGSLSRSTVWSSFTLASWSSRTSQAKRTFTSCSKSNSQKKRRERRREHPSQSGRAFG